MASHKQERLCVYQFNIDMNYKKEKLKLYAVIQDQIERDGKLSDSVKEQIVQLKHKQENEEQPKGFSFIDDCEY